MSQYPRIVPIGVNVPAGLPNYPGSPPNLIWVRPGTLVDIKPGGALETSYGGAGNLPVLSGQPLATNQQGSGGTLGN
jgi:hypothetical protein